MFAHNYSFQGFKFLPLRALTDMTEGDWDPALLQAESKWIFRLQADKPPGLNESLSICPASINQLLICNYIYTIYLLLFYISNLLPNLPLGRQLML